MTDKVGKLGQAIIATQGTTTAYQCPAGKGAKCQVYFRGAAGTNSTLQITVSGIAILLTAALTAGNISYSTVAATHNTGAASAINGSSDSTTVAPGPRTFWLSAGDTISYTIGTADFSSMNFQVVGVEVDVA